ncbi:MAG: GntR family transcriptional regulator [Lachnospiraceae bacterium]|nr:GntR family transcriptional regulator [Lachnospiraceae bacterium]
MSQSAKEKAYEYIRQLVLDNPLSNDINLSETAIAEAIGVSRTPVREAMSLLASEGFIEIIPNKGPVKMKPDLNNIMMITQIMEGLEGIAARVACKRADKSVLEDLREEFAALTDLDDPEQMDKARLCGYRLHDTIVKSTGNPRLIKIVDNLILQRHMISRLAPLTAEIAKKRYAQHMEILDAILARDSDLAEGAMRKHVVDVAIDAANALYKSYLY